MLVEDAERYGISQLHQLRGRVGRGEHASLCLLFGPQGVARGCRRSPQHRDGFALAEIDLELRGEGELLGTRQSGLAAFRVARLPEDAELLDRARAARRGAARRPTRRCAEPEHALLERRRRSAAFGAARPLRADPAREGRRPDAGRSAGAACTAPPGAATRPTSDRVREALFSVLGDRVDGARVLDLFAGSGALGIEALSRGAAEARVRRRRRARDRGRCGPTSRRSGSRRRCAAATPCARLRAAHRRAGRQYDLVFLDPPYRRGGAPRARAVDALPAVLAPGARGGLRERPPRAARPRPAPPRRTPLRRHPDPHPWLPITASPSAPAPTTRSPTGTSTSSRAPPTLFDEVIVAVVNASVRKSKALFSAEERCAFIEDATAHLGQRPRRAVRRPRRRLRARAAGPRRSSRACARSRTSSTSSR